MLQMSEKDIENGDVVSGYGIEDTKQTLNGTSGSTVTYTSPFPFEQGFVDGTLFHKGGKFSFVPYLKDHQSN
jgi:hypothetical protein